MKRISFHDLSACSMNANAIVERELDIRGCSMFCEEQREVLPLLASLTSKLERVMAPCIPLEQLPLEYERLLSGQSGFLKTIVRF
jgi:(R,R)-butanediol dehydrogenase/meso-butanediol dehydrogenase/diacetyl reductase